MAAPLRRSTELARIIHQAGPMVLQPRATPGIPPDGYKNRSTVGACRESGMNPIA
jgi:hypothetical protein